MKQEYTIELVEEYENVNFYSIHLNGKELTEMESFFEKFPIGCEYDDEIDTIIAWIDKIAEKGALERYFKPEGHYGDGVGVIPIDLGKKLRLYCLRLSDQIVILGNGGVKVTRTYEQDPKLYGYVLDLQRFERILKKNIEKGYVHIQEKVLSGIEDIPFEI